MYCRLESRDRSHALSVLRFKKIQPWLVLTMSTLKYPIDPTLEVNPFKDFKRNDWNVYIRCTKDQHAFDKKWEIVQRLGDNENIHRVKNKDTNGYQIAKIYILTYLSFFHFLFHSLI